MRRYIYLLGFFTIALGVTLSFGSCRKKGDTIAKITVRDTANALVPGAQVILYGTSTEAPIKPVVRRDTAYTDASGVALFNYNEVYQLGQAGFAVLNIAARKGEFYGEGMIKVEEEKVSEATVLIQP